MKREEQIINAITTDGFEHKGIFYRTLSTRMMVQLERFNSPHYYGGPQLKGLLDALYISSKDIKDVERIKVEDFDSIIYEYADTLTPEDLKELGEKANIMHKEAASTIVEVREDSAKKK